MTATLRRSYWGWTLYADGGEIIASANTAQSLRRYAQSVGLRVVAGTTYRGPVR
jgi:predicted GNAT family acetyltransferase